MYKKSKTPRCLGILQVFHILQIYSQEEHMHPLPTVIRLSHSNIPNTSAQNVATIEQMQTMHAYSPKPKLYLQY